MDCCLVAVLLWFWTLFSETGYIARSATERQDAHISVQDLRLVL